MGVFIVSLGDVVAEQTQGRRGVVVSVRDTTKGWWRRRGAVISVRTTDL